MIYRALKFLAILFGVGLYGGLVGTLIALNIVLAILVSPWLLFLSIPVTGAAVFISLPVFIDYSIKATAWAFDHPVKFRNEIQKDIDDLD